MCKSFKAAALFAIALTVNELAFGLNITDDFTQGAVNDSPGGTNSNGIDWVPIGIACLTAGNATNNSTTVANTASNYSNIPACNLNSTNTGITTPEAVGSGALRLTADQKSQVGAIVSQGSFPSNQGLQVTFTTYTYGNSSTSGGDGIGFFLQDASVPLTLPYVGGHITDTTTSSLGSAGGSLGFTCSNLKDSNYNGLTGGYLGLGIDEFGNFTNGGPQYFSDATATRWDASTPANPGRSANTISLRGAGNVSWYYLSNRYPSLYPTSLSDDNQLVMMHNTCRTGVLQSSTVWTTSSLSYSNGVLTVTGSTNAPFAVGDTINMTGVVQGNTPRVNGNTTAGSYVVTAVSGKSISFSYSNGSTTYQYPTGGSITANLTYKTSGLSWSNGVLTVSTSTNVGFLAGDTIKIAASGSAPTVNGKSIVGSYVVTGVNGSKFTVSFPNGSTSYANTSNGRVTVQVMDYATIPNSAVTLPTTTPIASTVATRAAAKPVTYKLSISPGGLLNFQYSYNGGTYQPVLTNTSITSSNGTLPSNFRFGFLGSTGQKTNVHEITCFAAQPTESGSSAGANTVQSGQVRTGTQVYLASYNPNTWNGSLVSDAIVNTNGVLSVSNTAQWDADCVLTGGGCASMGTVNGQPTTTITAQAPSARNILTWNGSAGVPFQWTNLTSAQQSVLNSTDSAGSTRLDYLRGVRTQEQVSSGALRTRAGVLGDIIDSGPTWVGPPAKNYGARFTDALTGTVGPESSYATFKNGLATRLHVVYSGSNDGMLHGFRTGKNKSDGTYDSTLNDGQEVLAFVPSTVLSNSNVVSFTNPLYTHSFFVDAAPGFGDVYYNGAWHSWLVGGMGPGGNEIYALDVTDPTGLVTSSLSFSEAHASSLVVGDWTASSLSSCVNAATSCGNNLGNTYGTPLVRRLHNGNWAIIFGNGLGSANAHAGVFVGVISSSDGSVSFYWLDTGSGDSTNPNGIASVSSGDLDGDFVVDYLYAGDLQGNVWRFDLTSSDPANWAVSTFGQSSPTPLYVAKDGNGTRQPITSSIAVTANLTGGAQRVMLGFGTGRATPFTDSSATTYQSGTQTVYGIWDWDMTAWNGISNTKYAALAASTGSGTRTISRTDLAAVSMATQTGSTRTAATSVVCWNGSTACASGNTQYGWKFDLPDSGEQVIYNPVFSGGELLLNTVIPPASGSGQCILQLPTGWTMAFNMASGGGQAQNVFPDANGSLVVASGASSIVGLKQGAVGTPYIVAIGSKQYEISSTASGGPASINQLNTQGGVIVKPVSWEQLR